MKTLRISDYIHRKMTATVGTLMAQTGKMQTYQDAIEAMLTRSVILPTELLAEIENFIETSIWAIQQGKSSYVMRYVLG